MIGANMYEFKPGELEAIEAMKAGAAHVEHATETDVDVNIKVETAPAH